MPRSPGAAKRSSTSWRERASSARTSRASSRCSGRSIPSTRMRRAGGDSRGGIVQAPAPARCEQERVHAQVERGAAQAVEAADGSALAGEEGRLLARARGAAPGSCARSRMRLAHAPGAVGGHRQARRGSGGAATWPRQPASVRSSRASDGRAPAAGVEAPRRPAAHVGGAAERSEARVGGGAAVVERGARHVEDRRAGSWLAPVFRSRSCHSCSSPPCSSETSNGPTRCRAARRIAMFAPHA